MMLSRPKIYKENQQAVRIIFKNKNIQALMTKHVIWSFSASLLLFRNNNIVTQWQFIFNCINNYYKNILDLLKGLLYLWYNKTDLISVLTIFHWEQKYKGIVTMPSVYVFFGNKNILSRTKIYGSKLENNLMLQRNNKLLWTWVNGQNFDTEQNYRLCCGYQLKKQSHTTFPWCIQHQLKYIVYWNNVRGKHREQCWLVSKQQNMEEMDYDWSWGAAIICWNWF